MKKPPYINSFGEISILSENYEQFEKFLSKKLADKMGKIRKAVIKLYDKDNSNLTLYKHVQYELTHIVNSIISDDIYARIYFGMRIPDYEAIGFRKMVDDLCEDMFERSKYNNDDLENTNKIHELRPFNFN